MDTTQKKVVVRIESADGWTWEGKFAADSAAVRFVAELPERLNIRRVSIS